MKTMTAVSLKLYVKTHKDECPNMYAKFFPYTKVHTVKGLDQWDVRYRAMKLRAEARKAKELGFIVIDVSSKQIATTPKDKQQTALPPKRVGGKTKVYYGKHDIRDVVLCKYCNNYYHKRGIGNHIKHKHPNMYVPKRQTAKKQTPKKVVSKMTGTIVPKFKKWKCVCGKVLKEFALCSKCGRVASKNQRI